MKQSKNRHILTLWEGGIKSLEGLNTTKRQKKKGSFFPPYSSGIFCCRWTSLSLDLGAYIKTTHTTSFWGLQITGCRSWNFSTCRVMSHVPSLYIHLCRSMYLHLSLFGSISLEDTEIGCKDLCTYISACLALFF